MLCERDAYLLELVHYIQLNPARLRNPEGLPTYRWNSHGANSGRKMPVTIDSTLVLNQLGNSPSDADKAYRKFIDDGRGVGHDDRYYQAVDRRFLRDEKFVERIAKLASQGEIGPDGRKLRFEKLLSTVAQVHGYRVDDLTAAGRQCACARSRGQLAYLARATVRLEGN